MFPHWLSHQKPQRRLGFAHASYQAKQGLEKPEATDPVLEAFGETSSYKDRDRCTEFMQTQCRCCFPFFCKIAATFDLHPILDLSPIQIPMMFFVASPSWMPHGHGKTQEAPSEAEPSGVKAPVPESKSLENGIIVLDDEWCRASTLQRFNAQRFGNVCFLLERWWRNPCTAHMCRTLVNYNMLLCNLTEKEILQPVAESRAVSQPRLWWSGKWTDSEYWLLWTARKDVIGAFLSTSFR